MIVIMVPLIKTVGRPNFPKLGSY